MLKIRKSNERGAGDHGWLKSYHTFSFADYYDPSNMSFRTLRVINEDKIAGGGGFPTHPHRDMEIVTYMIEGELAHRDSMGNSEVIRRGEVQYMCAGTGIAHSEFNAHQDKEAHLLQIWIMPDKTQLKPGYGQKSFMDEFSKGHLVKVLSSDGSDGSVKIHQDAKLWVGWLKPQTLTLPLSSHRHGWLQVVKGEIEMAGNLLKAGDAVAMSNENDPQISLKNNAEILFFDLA
ncbi:MAG: pirin family protein [Bacteriovoracaceae bacterium]|nr:pirin family protein [Bacteriovoracaceae bacterium]